MTDVTEAQKVIAEANLAADKACLEEIQAVLKKHGRGLVVSNIALAPDGRMLPQITVMRVGVQPAEVSNDWPTRNR